MGFQTVFCRYELKYLLTLEEKERILEQITPLICSDPYGKTTIRNVYFDTNCFRLIRRSLEKPLYKEKLRLRSYCQATRDSTVFVELKKKYRGVVYKRRISLKEREAMDWTLGKTPCPKQNQISREIDYFLDFYAPLRPSVFLSYERESFFAKDDPHFRITFDQSILFRQEDLSLTSTPYGTSLLPENQVLMELKCAGGIPLWMVNILSREHLYKTSFSKYGKAYENFIFPKNKKEIVCYA